MAMKRKLVLAWRILVAAGMVACWSSPEYLPARIIRIMQGITEAAVIHSHIQDYKVFSIGSKYGLIDKNGHVTVNALYEYINAIDNDLFSCKIAYMEDYCITINGKGETIR